MLVAHSVLSFEPSDNVLLATRNLPQPSRSELECWNLSAR